MDEKGTDKAERSGLYFSIFAILILVLFLLLGVYLVRQKTFIKPRASGGTTGTGITGKEISLDNSYIFASPVRASAGGDLIRVTVFLLDSEGYGIFDKEVVLGNDNLLSISEVQNLTDETGKAVFDIASNKKGTFYVEASVDQIKLPQKVKIVFD